MGHAFLGSAMRGAHLDGAVADRGAQARRAGPGPARPRAPLPGALAAEPVDHGCAPSAPWTWRSGTSPARSRACPSTGCSAPTATGAAPTRARPCSPPKQAYAEEAARFKAEGWTAYKIHPPTDPATRHRDLPGGAAARSGDGFTVMLDSTLGLRLSRRRSGSARPSRSSASTGTRTRWPTTTSTTTSSSSSSSTSRSSPPSTRRAASPPTRPWLVARATDFLRGRRRGQGRDHGAASRRRTSPRPST